MGKTLLTKGISTLLEEGYPSIYLWVFTENHRARSFYERNGFKPSGEKKNLTIGGKVIEEMEYIYIPPST